MIYSGKRSKTPVGGITPGFTALILRAWNVSHYTISAPNRSDQFRTDLQSVLIWGKREEVRSELIWIELFELVLIPLHPPLHLPPVHNKKIELRRWWQVYLKLTSLSHHCRSVHASIMSSFNPFRRSVIKILADEKTLSHSADIKKIERRSNTIFDNREYFSRWSLHHCKGYSQGLGIVLQYFSYSSRMAATSCWS